MRAPDGDCLVACRDKNTIKRRINLEGFIERNIRFNKIGEANLPPSTWINLCILRSREELGNLEQRHRLELERMRVLAFHGTFTRWYLLEREKKRNRIQVNRDQGKAGIGDSYVRSNSDSDCCVGRKELGRPQGHPVSFSIFLLGIFCKRGSINFFLGHQSQWCIRCIKDPVYKKDEKD